MVHLHEISTFLQAPTPNQWVNQALANLDLLLIDHAQCEKKAASTAMSLMYRYTDKPELLEKLCQLAREELLHFEKVLGILKSRNITYRYLPAGDYAQKLMASAAKKDPDKLIDILIIGAYIEARSCERFALLAPKLDSELNQFYTSLLRSEARHFRDYLALARLYSQESIEPRIKKIGQLEAQLITGKDMVFRFHSGVLVTQSVALSPSLCAT